MCIARNLERQQALEHLGRRARIQARPRIQDRELSRAVVLLCDHRHVRAQRRVTQGVVEQDTHDLSHPFTVAHGVHRVVRQPQVELRLVLGDCGLELLRHRLGELGEVHLLVVQLHRARVEARQVEEVHGELLEPVHLVLHRGEELLVLRFGRGWQGRRIAYVALLGFVLVAVLRLALPGGHFS